MNCTELIEVVQGATLEYTVSLTNEETKLPYDLTGATEIKACHPGTSGAVEGTLTGGQVTVLNATLGQLQVKLPAATTPNLNPGEQQTIEIQVTEADGDIVIVQFLEKLTVVASIC